MRRREVIAGLAASAALSSPVASLAQQREAVRRIAILLPFDEGDPDAQRRLAALREGLVRLGWSEGRNIQMDIRWLGKDPRLNGQAYVAELVQAKPEVIISASTRVIEMLKEATSTIPIVFAAVADPVASGFVASLARPGGNITGFTSFAPPLAGKWLELLKEVAPGTRRVLLLSSPMGFGSAFLREFESASRSFGITPIGVPITSIDQVEGALAAESGAPGSSLAVQSDVFLFSHREDIIGAASRHGLPAAYAFREWAASGGLLSYGPDVIDEFRRAPDYVDRILRGAHPGELPVQQPTKFELVINLKTAKALGITVPQSILVQADEVIE
jgi:putative tryptophan/tyrosine transport system substrate-binding protein